MRAIVISIFIVVIGVFIPIHNLDAQVITTIAGNDTAGFSGDGGPATIAKIHGPNSVVVDNSGNIYIADCTNNRVRKVSGSGIITTIAGNGTGGYTIDGIAATASELNAPTGVALDNSGNIYIADFSNNRIRKVNTSGIISTVAGNGIAGYSAEGIAATLAALHQPSNIAVDSSGNIYIAEIANMRVRKVNTSGIINTIAGNGHDTGAVSGFSGDGGPATAAELYLPNDVAVDNIGNVYISDQGNLRVRKVDTAGMINTFIGNGTFGFSGDGGLATAAKLSDILCVRLDNSGNIYIADEFNNRIRKINSSGIITSIAGDGTQGYSGDGGSATNAELNYPVGVALDNAGNVYIADFNNNCIRKVGDHPTAVQGLANSAEYIHIYPNPTLDRVTLEILGTGNNIVASLLDMNGKIIETREYMDNMVAPHSLDKITFQTGNLPAGTYLVRVDVDGHVNNRKVIVAGGK